ncbi:MULTISPECIES: hypothetical protein [unclassified Bradyrhizobium]|uniref:hypothetical protein n=1 Tax=unclassified Bradyrhizobium TaxID=2631580 RepID=UPI001373DA19|nr:MULTISPECIES: hypothetical protein [unclassified Bradyrhizobium]QHP73063.1 hypothetical protein EI171_40710 [Bradyrhizobium sp. LCT2]
MSPANAGLSGSQRPLGLGHSGRASALFLTCINYCDGCLLIQVIFQSKVRHMADRKTWRPIIFSCPDTGDLVQGLLPDAPEPCADDLHPIACVACDGALHRPADRRAMIGAERIIRMASSDFRHLPILAWDAARSQGRG